MQVGTRERGTIMSIGAAVKIGVGLGLVGGIIAEEAIAAKTGDNHAERWKNVAITSGISAGVGGFIGMGILNNGWKTMPMQHRETTALLLGASVAFAGAAILGAAVREALD